MSRVDLGKVTDTNKIAELETKVTSLEGTVATHGTDIGTLKTTVASHGTSIGTLQNDVNSIEGDVANLQSDVNKLKPILVNVPANGSTTISGYTSGNSDRRLLIFAHASNAALRGIYIALSTNAVVPLVEATGLTLSASGGTITVQNNTSNSANGIVLT